MNAPQPLIIHNPLSTQNDGELTAKHDMKKYGSLLPLVCKIKKNLAELQKADESILNEILSPFHHHTPPSATFVVATLKKD